jgi:hypothetical protein
MSTTSSRVPPHLKGLLPNLGALIVDDQSVSAKSNEVQPTNVGSTTNHLPPHLSNRKRPQQESGGSITGSISTATTLRNEKKEVTAARQITFNAWDKDGQKHRAIKNPTVMSSSISAASAAGENQSDSKAIGETENGSNIVGDRDDIPPAPEPQVRKGGKWPKSSEVSTPRTEVGPLSNPESRFVSLRQSSESGSDSRMNAKGSILMTIGSVDVRTTSKSFDCNLSNIKCMVVRFSLRSSTGLLCFISFWYCCLQPLGNRRNRLISSLFTPLHPNGAFRRQKGLRKWARL